MAGDAYSIDPESILALRQKLDNPLGSRPGDLASFQRKVLASPAAIDGIDRGERLAEYAGNNPYTRAASVAMGPLGALASYGSNALTPPSDAPSRARGGPDDLSDSAQRQLRVDDAGSGPYRLTPIGDNTSVPAAPTLAEQAKKVAPATGAGGGGGSGLKGAYDAARQAGVRTLEDERELTGQLGVDKAGKTMAMADLQQAEGDRLQRQADIEANAQNEAKQRFDDFLTKSQSRINDLAAAKTDPGRLLRGADAKTQLSIGMGAALGGALAAVNGGPNTSIDHLDKIIQRDIASQENALDNQKSAASMQNSMLGQLIQESGSREIARKQLYTMTLEAAKAKIQADADRLGIPEMRTNGELATNAIQQKIDGANVQIKKDAWELYQRQAAAAAAAAQAAEQRAWERSMKVTELGQKQDEIRIKQFEAGMGPDGQPLTGPDGKPVAGAGLDKAARSEIAKKQFAAQQELDGNVSAIDRAEKNVGKLTEGSALGEQWAKLPAWAPGATTAIKNKQERDDFNVRAMMIVGAAYKLGTDSTEPKRKELLEHYSDPYVIKPTDNEEVARHKIAKLRGLLADSAAAQGASLPMPASVQVKR